MRTRTRPVNPGYVHRNTRGVVLLTVILVTIVLSIIVIGIMSMNVSHVKTGEDVIESVRVEELAKGLFYQKQQVMLSGQGTSPSFIDVGVTPDIKRYNIQVDCTSDAGPNSTDKINVCVGDNCSSPCTPNCIGKECGSDGCCGTCPPGCAVGDTCDQNGQCQTP